MVLVCLRSVFVNLATSVLHVISLYHAQAVKTVEKSAAVTVHVLEVNVHVHQDSKVILAIL